MSDAESKAIRRRWLSIGELVAVAGVLIAGGTFYLNWQDREQATAERAAEKAGEARKAARVTFTGTVRGDTIALADAAHPAVAAVDVSFPPALGAKAQSGLIEPRIEAGWFARELLAATDGGADEVEGRLPVLITATVPGDDRPSVSRAIYDVAFATDGRTFGGRVLTLKGVALRERDGSAARLDQLWAAERKRIAALGK